MTIRVSKEVIQRLVASHRLLEHFLRQGSLDLLGLRLPRMMYILAKADVAFALLTWLWCCTAAAGLAKFSFRGIIDDTDSQGCARLIFFGLTRL